MDLATQTHVLKKKGMGVLHSGELDIGGLRLSRKPILDLVMHSLGLCTLGGYTFGVHTQIWGGYTLGFWSLAQPVLDLAMHSLGVYTLRDHTLGVYTPRAYTLGV